MSLPTHILVPTDFGDHSDAALGYAVDLAKATGARITLAHFLSIPVAALPETAIMYTPEMIDEATEATEATLEKQARKQSGVEIRTSVRRADPREGILQTAAEEKADLIIMGTHGRRGFKHLLMGSVAEAMVRASPCPVLTVRAAK